jgi:hypothetical protein
MDGEEKLREQGEVIILCHLHSDIIQKPSLRKNCLVSDDFGLKAILMSECFRRWYDTLCYVALLDSVHRLD